MNAGPLFPKYDAWKYVKYLLCGLSAWAAQPESVGDDVPTSRTRGVQGVRGRSNENDSRQYLFSNVQVTEFQLP